MQRGNDSEVEKLPLSIENSRAHPCTAFYGDLRLPLTSFYCFSLSIAYVS